MSLLPLAVLLLAAGGCASRAALDYDRIAADLEPLDYARILCQGEALSDRHSCLTAVVAHYRATLDTPRDFSTSGPFVLVLANGARYLGHYQSHPFAQYFSATNARARCAGGYAAVQGDAQPVLKIHCDDGRRGTANLILDYSGRNGLGEVQFDDGMRGQVVFGEAAAGALF